jgi:hypothetical protein
VKFEWSIRKIRRNSAAMTATEIPITIQPTMSAILHAVLR